MGKSRSTGEMICVLSDGEGARDAALPPTRSDPARPASPVDRIENAGAEPTIVGRPSEISHLAGRRGRAGQPAAARRLLGDHARRRRRRRSTRSSTSSTRIIARSKPSSAGCAPTCTSRASSCAITCSTPSASMPTDYQQRAGRIPHEPTWRRWPSCARSSRAATKTSGSASLQAQLEDYWRALRAADRLDASRKRSHRAPRSCAAR